MTKKIISSFFNKSAIKLVGVAVISLFAAHSASATYNYYYWQTQQAAANDPDTVNGNLQLSPGVYDPFVIGENIEFNACSTTFAGYSLCDLPDTSKFVIQWQAKTLDGSGNIVLYDSGVCNPWGGSSQTGASSDSCLNITVPGNTSSSIFTSSSFYIGIHIATHANYYIPLPNGEWGYTGSGGGQYGWMWTGMSLVESAPESGGGGGGEPSPVSEPLALLLMGPALGALAFRERRRKRKTLALASA
ncbi:hypothetical protein [Kordiimonas pumila]|uniref:PEP-CTERM protein-sorting domain-containing protein n=1 Tax=Kordiimonas pumila TaxID=2161677 RepID=A0ABV7D0Y6_9PROT|nr:hypothetical protein [Kordiimonas pumila]